MKYEGLDSIAAIGLIFTLPQLILGCYNYPEIKDRCNGVTCRDYENLDQLDPSFCESGYCDFSVCLPRPSRPFPTWATILITVVSSFVVFILLALVYRHCRIKRLKKAEAQFLAGNQTVAAGATPIIIDSVPYNYIPPQA